MNVDGGHAHGKSDRQRVVNRTGDIPLKNYIGTHGPLAKYVKLRIAHLPGMHDGMCVTHVPWCVPGSLASCFLWSRWLGKRSRRMHNPQFDISGKRPILTAETHSRELNITSRYRQLEKIVAKGRQTVWWMGRWTDHELIECRWMEVRVYRKHCCINL